MFRPESSGEVVNSRVESELKLTRSQLECLEVESMELNRELVACRSENVLLTQEIDKVKKDQEDLLVLLADQDSQIQKYKDRLKNLGQPVNQSSLLKKNTSSLFYQNLSQWNQRRNHRQSSRFRFGFGI